MGDKFFVIGVVVLAIGVLVFAGLYNSRNSGSNVSSLDSGAAGILDNNVNSGQSNKGNKAPDFTLQDLDGGTITLSQFAGEKPVILDFFATWCPNCQRDMPKLNKWYEEKYRDQVEVIGINLRESREKVESFIKSRGISFPIVLDPNGQVSQKYGIRYTNTHFLIDKEGNLVREIPGDISEAHIRSLIQ